MKKYPYIRIKNRDNIKILDYDGYMSKLNDLDKLHIFDTIHDFWLARDDNPQKQEEIQIYLVNFIKTFVKAGNNVAKLNDL